MNDPTPPDEELTTEQIVRFQILIDYHLAMEKKRQGDIGTNHISDGSEISKATWKRIEALIHNQEAKAERRGRIRMYNELWRVAKAPGNPIEGASALFKRLGDMHDELAQSEQEGSEE